MLREKIDALDSNKAKTVLTDFLDVYLDKGFGVMNKTEIETLLYHVLKKSELLSGRCFDDSLTLKITEAKSRKLLYESQVKYSTRDEDERTSYLRKYLGECLKRAYFSQNGKAIKFVIEDKYIRIALNAYLREHGFFADTSFNTDIVSLDQNAFEKIIILLVPNYQVDGILERVQDIDAITNDTRGKTGGEFLHSLMKDIMSKASVEGLKVLVTWIAEVLLVV